MSVRGLGQQAASVWVAASKGDEDRQKLKAFLTDVSEFETGLRTRPSAQPEQRPAGGRLWPRRDIDMLGCRDAGMWDGGGQGKALAQHPEEGMHLEMQMQMGDDGGPERRPLLCGGGVDIET